MIAVFLNAVILPRMGSGPFWEARIISESNYCSNNWWTNLLFVNNYVNAKELVGCSFFFSIHFH